MKPRDLPAEVKRLRGLIVDAVEAFESMGYAKCPDCEEELLDDVPHAPECLWKPLIEEARKAAK